jgi:hypothetical protein
MFDILSYKGSNTEVPSYPNQNGYHQEKQQQMLLMMWEENGTLTHSWWECKLSQPLWKSSWRSLKKLKLEHHTLSSCSTPGHISEGM